MRHLQLGYAFQVYISCYGLGFILVESLQGRGSASEQGESQKMGCVLLQFAEHMQSLFAAL